MKYLVYVLLLLAPVAYADEATERLNRALKQMDNLTADFKQTLLDEDKNVVQQSRGTLALQRPGKVRLDLYRTFRAAHRRGR